MHGSMLPIQSYWTGRTWTTGLDEVSDKLLLDQLSAFYTNCGSTFLNEPRSEIYSARLHSDLESIRLRLPVFRYAPNSYASGDMLM